VELIVSAATLSRELALIQGVIEKRTTHQILSNVLMEATGDRLRMTATDLDTTFITEVEVVSTVSSGAVTVPARRLHDAVRDLPAEAELRIKVLENHHVQLECKSPKLRIRLNGLSATDYPTRPEFPGGPALELSFGSLRRMVDKVRFAVSVEEIRLQLQGALLKSKGGGAVEMAATDGHRLALVEVGNAKANGGFEPVIVSKKILDELSKVDAPPETPVEIVRSANHLGFSIGGRKLLSKMEDRKFPDYEKVIGRENDKKVVVDREGLLGAVKRISLLSGDRMKAITITFQEGSIQVASESQEVGDGDQEVSCSYEHEKLSLRLNARYLEQFLEVAESKEVHLFLKDEQSQCQGRPAEAIGGLTSYLYVVMPLRA
jgi:DNA polymerase-3 subunit beta